MHDVEITEPLIEACGTCEIRAQGYSFTEEEMTHFHERLIGAVPRLLDSLKRLLALPSLDKQGSYLKFEADWKEHASDYEVGPLKSALEHEDLAIGQALWVEVFVLAME